jgi:uncharacterized protein YkwD
MLRLFAGRGLTAARRRSVRAQRLRRPELQNLEDRRSCAVSVSVQPTDAEQYMLFEINQARSNPPAEAQRLLALSQTDPLVQRAAQSTDRNAFLAEMNSLPALPPLAFNPRLIAAARSQDFSMLASNRQQHSPQGFLTDPSVATADDGDALFPTGDAAWATGENIFAYSQSVQQTGLKAYVDYFEEGLILDWGNPDFGHLRNLMAPGVGEMGTVSHVPFNQIGIGILSGVQPTTPPPANPELPANQGLNVGPVLLTQEFAWSAGTQFLTGVIYQDKNSDGAYSIGEGYAGVTLSAVGDSGQGVFQTTTWGSGGYSLELPPGPYHISATGALPTTQTTEIVIGADNVGWNVRLPAPAPSGPTSMPVAPATGSQAVAPARDAARRTQVHENPSHKTPHRKQVAVAAHSIATSSKIKVHTTKNRSRH